MRAMKDSGIEWIGQIPQEWEISRVKHLYDVTLGKMLQPAPKSDDDELCSYMCAANINWSGVDLSVEKKMWFSAKDKESYRLAAGDLLVTEGGDVAVSCIWNDELPECYIQNAVHRVLPKSDASNRYLYYWLSTLKATGYIDLVCNKATLAHFTKDKFDSCVIPVVSADEQHTIANYLDVKCAEIDALIATKEKTNALLKERRQSIIYEAVTKGLNPDAPMKDSGIEWIGEIPVHWEVERLKHHIEFNPKTEIPEYGEDDSVSFIPMDCLRRGVHTFQTVDYSKVKSGYVDFAEGDILMAKVTPCLENGNLAIAGNLIDGVGFGSTEINVIRCKSIHREYLFYILQCKTYVDRAVADMYGVAGLKRLNPSFIPNTKYPMPSIEEQQKIAEYLAATCGEIDELVVANERTIEKLKEYRQSVIYEAVTGKIEI